MIIEQTAKKPITKTFSTIPNNTLFKFPKSDNINIKNDHHSYFILFSKVDQDLKAVYSAYPSSEVYEIVIDELIFNVEHKTIKTTGVFLQNNFLRESLISSLPEKEEKTYPLKSLSDYSFCIAQDCIIYKSTDEKYYLIKNNQKTLKYLKKLHENGKCVLYFKEKHEGLQSDKYINFSKEEVRLLTKVEKVMYSIVD